MKKIIVMVLVCLFLLGACGSNKTICFNGNRDCHEFQQYGLLSLDRKNTEVRYDVVWGNVVWGAILLETVIVPIILFGWMLYEPAGIKTTDMPGAL